MCDPAKEKQPQQGACDEVNQRPQNPPLHELAESGNEEAADGRDDVTGGSLSGHDELDELSPAIFQLAARARP